METGVQWAWWINMAASLGLSVAVLILVALGLAVLFGMMGIINLAHGEFLMFGAFATLGGVRFGLPLPLAMLAAVACVAAFGWLVERFLVRHLYGRLADSMLATWGLSLIMAQSATLLFGASTQGIATPGGSLRIGDYSIAWYSLLLIAAALALMILLYLVFTRTRYGVMAGATAADGRRGRDQPAPHPRPDLYAGRGAGGSRRRAAGPAGGGHANHGAGLYRARLHDGDRGRKPRVDGKTV